MHRFILSLLLLSSFVLHADEGISISILPNKGQVTDQHFQSRTDIDAAINIGHVALFIGAGQMHYQWSRQVDDSTVDYYRMDVELLGADNNTEPFFEDLTGYSESYYLSYISPDGIITNGYRKLTYKNIYPNIDWVLYISQSGLVKYDFIVHPGGDPDDIQLQYKGADNLSINDGALVASTPMGTVTEQPPYCYELETNKELSSEYSLEGNILKTNIEAYEGTLVIDPVLVWATYFAGNKAEWFDAVDVDEEGNVFACGISSGGSANIATTGAFQTTASGSEDGIMVKYAPGGQRVWSSFYGGTAYDKLQDLCIDKAGNVYFMGNTYSQNLAHGNVHQNNFSNANAVNSSIEDVLVIKMNTTGQRIWATYYGDTMRELGLGIDCDTACNIYIAGATGSTQGIATTGAHKPAYQTSNGDFEESFIVKFDSTGNRIWGTYFGGDSVDQIYDIDVAKDGTIAIGGRTGSAQGIATNGAHLSTFIHATVGNNIREIPFIAKFTTNGDMVWGTYYGTDTLGGVVSGIQIDEAGNVYATGSTSARSGIGTSGTHLQNWPSNITASLASMGFIVKFNNSGTREWGTYYGGGHSNKLTSLTLGIQDGLYVYGATTDTTGIATNGAYQSTFNGGYEDAAVARFNSQTGTLSWGTYFGGTGQELTGSSNAFGEVVYHDHKAYFNLRTVSNDIPTVNADQDTLIWGVEGFVAAMYVDTIVYIDEPFTDTSVCAGDTIQVPYEISYHFRSNNKFTVQLSDQNGSFVNAVNIGVRTDSLADTVTCVIPLNTPSGNGYRIKINADMPAFYSEENVFDINIKPRPSVTATNNTPVCEADTVKLFANATPSTVSFAWTGPLNFSSSQQNPVIAAAGLPDTGYYFLQVTNNGCAAYDTTFVTLKPLPDTPTISSNSPVCRGTTLHLGAGSTTTGVSYVWTGPNNFSDTAQQPVVNNATYSDSGTYTVYTTLNGCASAALSTKVVVDVLTPTPVLSANSPVCIGQDLQLNANNMMGATYNWYGPAAFSDTAQNPVRQQVPASYAGTYYAAATLNDCISDTASITVQVNPQPTVNIFASPGADACQGDEITFNAVPANAGTTPTYMWTVNHINTGLTGTIYKNSAHNHGDQVRCVMTSTGVCAQAYTDTSNDIVITHLGQVQPLVSVTATPARPLHPNEPVSFTATPVYGGAQPRYQWLRNGVEITGATQATWGANANFLSDGDEICVMMYSSMSCAIPDSAKSNCIQLEINVGVDEITGNSNISIYPNPVTNRLYIKGLEVNTAIVLYDATGRTVYTATATTGEYIIKTHALAAGTYLLHLTNAEGNRTQARVTKW